MNRFALAFGVIALSTGAAVAQAELVTRAIPADSILTGADRALLRADTVTVTTGAAANRPAAEILTEQDRVLLGVDRQAEVSVTVVPGGAAPASIR